MAYNLYHAQMAKAWVQRVEKEQLLADRFWSKHAAQTNSRQTDIEPFMKGNLKDIETCSSIAPTYVSDIASTTPTTEVIYSSFLQDDKEKLLKNRLEQLEQELRNERQKRLEIEEDLNRLKSTVESKNSQ